MTQSENAKDGDATVSPFLVTLARLLKGKLKVRQRASDRRGFCFLFLFFRDRLHSSANKSSEGGPLSSARSPKVLAASA